MLKGVYRLVGNSSDSSGCVGDFIHMAGDSSNSGNSHHKCDGQVRILDSQHTEVTTAPSFSLLQARPC